MRSFPIIERVLCVCVRVRAGTCDGMERRLHADAGKVGAKENGLVKRGTLIKSIGKKLAYLCVGRSLRKGSTIWALRHYGEQCLISEYCQPNGCAYNASANISTHTRSQRCQRAPDAWQWTHAHTHTHPPVKCISINFLCVASGRFQTKIVFELIIRANLFAFSHTYRPNALNAFFFCKRQPLSHSIVSSRLVFFGILSTTKHRNVYVHRYSTNTCEADAAAIHIWWLRGEYGLFE